MSKQIAGARAHVQRRTTIIIASTALIGALIVAASPVDGLSLETRRQTFANIIPAATAAGVSLPLPPFVQPASAANADDDERQATAPQFRRYPQIRFIAALGDPDATSGIGADGWGLWRDDPGPRGVYLRNYERSLARTGLAPAGWSFRPDDWWLEEHGLIMSNPESLPRRRYDRTAQQIIPFKRYVVTGDREVTTVLTVYDDGRWELRKGNLYDVTHLPCRSARYTPRAEEGAGTCIPSKADGKMFPVKPGAAMPPVPGCTKKDYAVLFVLGEEA